MRHASSPKIGQRPARLLATVSALALANAPSPALACTAFLQATGERYLLAKSYDWHTAAGQVLYNKRGVRKQALLLDERSQPLAWTARHASLTFNQYGREMPNGGVNEAGLALEVLWLDASVYPPLDERPAINELQWIQHQLDVHQSVAEMHQAAQAARVQPVHGAVHYLACDDSGACAVFEHLGGHLVVTAGQELPAKALANEPYAAASPALASYQGFGGRVPRPTGRRSVERFVRAAWLARPQPPMADPLAAAFAGLDSVRSGAYTKWQVVWDLDQRAVHWRTSAARAIKQLALRDVDGACTTPVSHLDLDHRPAGPARAALQPWGVAANRALLAQSLAPLLGQLPPGTLERLAAYPAQLPCAPAAATAP